MQGRFKDYINSPKFNLYQSLHTTVIGLEGKPIEVQIRTSEMHRRAEYGIAAHWGYKEHSKDGAAATTAEMAWLQRIVDWQQETIDPLEFLETLKLDLEQDEVYVFTPKGKVIALAAGSTPIDFAYSIHTEVGHRCIGAKVNGRLVPLDTPLQSADTIEIITSKVPSAGPSRDWLQIVASPRARNKIRQWFSRERREDAMETGREELIKALRREGLPVQKLAASNALERLAAAMNYVDLDSLHASIGDGHVSARSVAQRLARDLRGGGGEEQLPTTVGPGLRTRTRRGSPVGVYVEGLDDVMVRLSRCCTPVPGDQIVGFVTRGRGVSVHRADCANATALAAAGQERLIEVEWDREGTTVFVASDRGARLRPFAPALGRDQGGVGAPPEHRVLVVADRARSCEPHALRRGAGRPRAPGVAHQLAQAPRRRVRRLPHAPRPEGLSPQVADQSAPLRAPAGTHDVLWPDSARWESLVAEFARRAQLGGFGLVVNPMFEDAQLFRRGIGDDSDVVRKEMYEFADRGGRDVALRPRARRRWSGPSSSIARRCRGRRGT